MAELLVIEGVVEEIIYQNIANGYTVCDIDVEGVFSTAVGIMPSIAPGEGVRLTGKWIVHPEYGEQFSVEICEKIMPTGKLQILQYLSSGIIKGIGPATAQKIVEKFGEEALAVIRDDPERLSKIRGISRKKAEEMQASLLEKQAVQSVVMFLQPYGVTANFAVRVFRALGPSAVTKIEENPYVLCQIDGIGFKTADKIAMQMGIDPANGERLKSGVKFVLSEQATAGHTYLPMENLTRAAASILGADLLPVENAITGMLLDGSLIKDSAKETNPIYLPAFFHAEMGIARRLYTILNGKNLKLGIEAEAALIAAERRAGISLSDKQKEACRMVMESGACVITGGPGTGKTTVINAIIEIMTSADAAVALCAPTGRAAKRMAETCGMEAKTIHRLLELNFTGGEKQVFGRNEEYPLEEDVIIVDEMSMVDVLLMNALLKAMKPGARLIMVGDADQLTSVGAGDVLRDILKSEVVPACRLTEIYRQAAESMICVGAHKINAGEAPEVNRKDKDFFLMHREDAEGILKTISDVTAARLPKAYGFDPMKDIQVICPSRKSALGINNVNRILQERLNPPRPDKREKAFGDGVLREGDKVMQVRNNYDITWKSLDNDEEGNGVFNGDVGIVYTIFPKGQYVEVLYEENKLVRYDFNQLEELEMAYAMTVHKSQGSEFGAVIIPMFPCAPQLMCRNLLYTAVTRAKKLVVLVGREGVMHAMIANNRQIERYSGLCDKIRGMQL